MESNNKVTLRNCAQVNVDLCDLSQPDPISEEYVKRANEYFVRSVYADDGDTHSLYQYADFLNACGKYNEAEHFYLLSLIANPNHWYQVKFFKLIIRDALYSYAEFLQKKRESEDEAQRFFQRAEQV